MTNRKPNQSTEPFLSHLNLFKPHAWGEGKDHSAPTSDLENTEDKNVNQSSPVVSGLSQDDGAERWSGPVWSSGHVTSQPCTHWMFQSLNACFVS